MLQTLGHALLVAIPLLIADVHRTRHANLALLRERLELAERTREQEAERRAEQERLRIARDLHDVVAHTLTTINVQAVHRRRSCSIATRRTPGARSRRSRTPAATLSTSCARSSACCATATSATRRSRPAPGLDDVPELVRRTRDDGVDVAWPVDGDRPQRLPERRVPGGIPHRAGVADQRPPPRRGRDGARSRSRSRPERLGRGGRERRAGTVDRGQRTRSGRGHHGHDASAPPPSAER